jgi:hypothetical protein
MPKASSFVCSGRTPMISAAISRSRMAIHDRPTRPRTRFLATSANTTTRARANTYRAADVASGPVTMIPKTVRVGAVMVPEEA